MTDLSWMLLPILATTVIVFTLGWFGLHVLQRGVIFVDLALAQIAALGTTYAVYLGHEPEGRVAFALSLLCTFIGAAAFSLARLFEERVPQEALIGIAYAVSAALGILLIHFAQDPHGGEKLEHLLVGNIVWVQPADLMLLAGVCGGVGLVHLALRKRFLQISFDPEAAQAEGRRVALWDLLFYLSFGSALTAIVSVSGVILVFSYLVIPAVIARLLVGGMVPRLILGWGLGLVVSVLGVSVSYSHPTGPMIVAFFGVALLLALGWHLLHTAADKVAMAGKLLGGLAAAGALIGAVNLIPVPPEHHEHAEEAPAAPAGDALVSPDAAARDAAARDAAGKADRVEALAGALAAETDPSVRLTPSIALLRSGDRRGLDGLVGLVSDETPFVRMEADGRLRGLAGAAAPAYDPLSGPDTAGVWRQWASGVQGLPAGASELAWP